MRWSGRGSTLLANRILCSFPGRNGDLLWALPTIRAIAEHYGVPVDLQISAEFTGLVPLLQRQPYLNHVWADQAWAMVPPDEWKAPRVEGYDHVVHCGYRGWPDEPLPAWVETGVRDAYQLDLKVDYDRPWITGVDPHTTSPYKYQITSGWSDEWFELKFGILRLLNRTDLNVVVPKGSRWATEGLGMPIFPCDWISAAEWIVHGQIFLGCCSALHVLATAMGKPVIVLEPSTARHNPIFYPFGMDGRIKVVKGNDGQLTHDVRHLKELLG
jgi:hypothetical protein